MQIINRCPKPPLGFEWQTRRSIGLLDQSHLVGLDVLVLEDEVPDPTDLEHAVEWVKVAHAEDTLAHVNGWYAASDLGAPAYVVLYARPIYRPLPSSLWWSTIPTLRILRTLAHELAHHLVATRGYVFQKGEDITDEESLASRYAESAVEKATQRWLYKLGQRCLKEIAGWHYAFAAVDWRQKKYKAAAERFYNAWSLDPEQEEAAYWYWRAKEMCDSESR